MTAKVMTAALVVALGSPAMADERPPLDPSLHASRTTAPPQIDGRLDDAAWQAAVPLRSFVQSFPNENSAPTESTEVRVLYDDRALYFAIRCADREPHRIVAPIARRDRPDLESDFVSVQIDSRGDRRTAFGFVVTAAGVQFDNTIYNDTELSLDWDAVWPSATSRDGEGWTAEFAVPLDVLRFDETSIKRWRIYLQRYISRRKELDEWPYLSRDSDAQVSRFGAFEGIAQLHPKRAMYIVPYAGLASVYARGDRARFDPSTGIDVKLALTSGLTLDATVLPDFGQIEADQLVLNLSTFETYVREKRAFFLEGADLFAPPLRSDDGSDLPTMQLFNSRRIGRTPDPLTALTGVVLSRSEPVTIAGAAKLSGRIGDRVTIGVLDAVTLAGKLTTDGAATPSNMPVTETLLPPTNFAVIRARHDFLAASAVGGTVAVVSPLERRDEFPTALTGGLDFTVQDAERAFAALGQVVGSARDGGTRTTIAPDGTMIGDGARGLGAQLQLAKQTGNWIGNVYGEYESAKLDLEAAGYLRRQNFMRTRGTLTFRELAPHGPFLQSQIDIVAEVAATADASTNVGRRVLVRPAATFGSFWIAGAALGGELAAYDVRETRDGTPLERPRSANGEIYVTTDNRRRIFSTVFARGSLAGRYAGEHVRTYTAGADTTLRLGMRTELLLGVAYGHQVDPPRFVYADAATATYYLAPLDARTASVRLNATVTLTQEITLQSFAQLFLADGVFRGAFAEQRGGDGRLSLDALAPASLPSEAGTGEFRTVELDANLVMRWEYRPGSTLFAVVTHQQQDRASSITGLLLKLSYFWK